MNTTDRFDAIIVLGGGRDNEGNLTNLSKQRLDAGCELYREGISNKIFALGGMMSTYSPNAIQFNKTGAKLRSEYMIGKGVKPEDIIKVEGGRDTIGESFVSRDTARKLGLKKLLLVTSDKHMERALYIFKRIFGPQYEIDSKEVPCGDILNAEEEKEYLKVTRELLESLPPEIPTPESWDIWREEHKFLYDAFKEIHKKYMKGEKETNEAYMGISNGQSLK